MVTKVMPVYRVDIDNYNHRGATDGAKKKPEQKTPFKEVFARALATNARPLASSK